MNPTRCFLLGVFWLIARTGHGQEIVLAPAFRSGMVLQRSERTRLYGMAGSNRWITVLWSPAREPSDGKPLASKKTEADGGFELLLDLRDPKFLKPFRLKLEEHTVTRRGKPGNLTSSIPLTNLVAGEVWLLADQPGRGMAATNGDLEDIQSLHYSPASTNIRLLDLTRTGLPATTAPKSREWEALDARVGGAERISALAVRLPPLLAPQCSVGVVLVTPKVLEDAVGATPREWADFNDSLARRWFLVNETLKVEQNHRWNARVRAKREGQIKPFEPILLYEQPRAYPVVLTTNLPLEACFDCRGAIGVLPTNAPSASRGTPPANPPTSGQNP